MVYAPFIPLINNNNVMIKIAIKHILCLLCCLWGFAVAHAQVQPQENALLNTIIIGFTIPKQAGTGTYILEIANGTQTDIASFEANVVHKSPSKLNRIVARVPEWNVPYSWRINFKNAKGNITKGKIYHFASLLPEHLSPTKNRLHIIKPAQKHIDAYIIADNTKAIYDMAGNIVWYLRPVVPVVTDNNVDVCRDIRVSPANTITLMYGNKAMEIDYQCRLLWQGILNDNKSHELENKYHHELFRRPNGNYMVMSGDNYYFASPMLGDTAPHNLGTQPAAPIPNSAEGISFASIIEYSPAGKKVWEWQSINAFNQSELFRRNQPVKNANLYLHANAFYLDEKKQCIYISFKSISQVMKIAYPSGKVLDVYGKPFTEHNINNMPFCEQHCPKINKAGELMLFNNNRDDPGGRPNVQIYKLPDNKGGKFQKIWEFTCPLNNTQEVPTLGAKDHFGSVNEISNSTDLLISVCATYGDIMIVNRQKEILWYGITEKWDDSQKQWIPDAGYRTNIIPNQKAMEALIWHDK
ncbi:MAG: hypothetical protein EBX41_03935 [Chitinophagia bacterium]|nr:hypothetical protein [Chitinophagia bacterium]